MDKTSTSTEKICADCMAHYPEGYKHVCPVFFKKMTEPSAPSDPSEAMICDSCQ